jgi:hypothetical protein
MADKLKRCEPVTGTSLAMHNALALFVCMMSDKYNRSNHKFPFSGFASYMSSGGANSSHILVQSICMQISTKYVILCKFYWAKVTVPLVSVSSCVTVPGM